MTRRAFLSVLCGAVTWPLAVAAQQSINEKRLAIFSPSESLVRLHAPSADLREHSESKFYRAFFAEAWEWKSLRQADMPADQQAA